MASMQHEQVGSEDLMGQTRYGRAALSKLGRVPENFRIYRAEWLGKRPEDWKSMRVTGRVFRARARGEAKGKLDVPVPGTIQTVIVTMEEMARFGSSEQPVRSSGEKVTR